MADITGVLLAAGSSTRFGGDKLLMELEGKPMLWHSASALSPCDRIVAVVRAEEEDQVLLLEALGIECIRNPLAVLGMGHSIACAVHATSDSHAWCILPGDMPFVSPSTTRQIVEALRDGANLAIPFCHGRRGHPVGFDSGFYEELIALKGDHGARRIVERHAHRITPITTADEGILVDIDTPADARARLGENTDTHPSFAISSRPFTSPGR